MSMFGSEIKNLKTFGKWEGESPDEEPTKMVAIIGHIAADGTTTTIILMGPRLQRRALITIV